MKEQWQELKETIIEIRDYNKFNEDVSAICKFLINYMGVLEAQVQEPCEYAPFTIEELKDEDTQKLFRKFKNQRVIEPCEDLISRKAEKRILEDRFMELQKLHDDKRYETNYCLNTILELPLVTSKAKWIPVSERLPEVNQRVLVTSYGRVCYAMMISADGNSGYPVFKLQDSLNEKVVCETTVHSEFTTSRIKAWMPLPEPYKAESEESNE